MDDSARFVAQHVATLPKSGIRDFFAIVSKMKDAVSLGIGEPDFVTPFHIREAAMAALEKGRTSYTDNRGTLALREEISRYVARNYGPEYNPEDEILVTVGVSEALDALLRATLNPGDKVLYHEPCYVSYAPSVTLCHATPVPIRTVSSDQFALDPAALRAAWQPGCKVLVLNFPTNPTGGTANRAKLEEIAKFAIEKDLLVASDEIYSELTFDGDHVSIASLPGMRERTVFLHGFSKAFAMTGFRIGYACGPAGVIDGMLKIHQYGIMCASIISQEAAVEALKNGRESMLHMRDKYRERRDFIVRRFNELGLPCHLPRGAFYAFPNITGTGLDSMTFASQLLAAQKVAMVPGTAFGAAGAGFCRASFSTSYERIHEAGERIARFLDTLPARK
ncbi:MAG: aminotransferase class I/II-fold pyridoxal phosphate-dependent enzyme [Verrucomicrobiae bacterium]|jgi:aminotransferase|nr:aminotransferase class I/II-fold pyridoxal phosphate-dependent enzyme [Verrucomicrobiae bacterium]PAW84812.1 MAG: aromatic amino acid aminotransferase [Opitutae bacterium Tous-C2FEB]PAZ03000.1 MAG: aromatic amino acid aminotransferase [Opitutae bacterium AMD-G3]